MSIRRLIRIGLSLGIIIVLWLRVGRIWREASATWLVGSLALSLILLLVVIFELSGVQQKWRRERDQVPKKPLGLDP